MTFVATAYCHGTTTAAGVSVRKGVVAADPGVLPLGTVINVQGAGRYDGAYTVLDTGPKVQGRRIDVFIRDCGEAVRFGRRSVHVSIVRRNTAPP
jgi:3D (Asp-Asp-Asp) domain-containing protein